ncbi:unnamed protein product [Amoebophrya sp. A120]|nr:unnamed protein product [Amoebophrya sp. A120]|eukprot:GSA120T00008458001.1
MPKKEREVRDARMGYIEVDEAVLAPEDKQKLEHYSEDILAMLHRNDPKDPKTLSLFGIHFSRHFYRDFAFCFMHNTRIRKLQLEKCNINDVACERLGFMLRENQAVQVLSLNENHIKSVGCGFIARLMDKGYGSQSKCELTHLFLNRNHIGPVGAKSLAITLAHNTYLQCLEVRENCIDDWGLGWLCMGLKSNTTLRQLDLQSNPIGENGRHELDGLRHATGRDIEVEDPIIGEESLKFMSFEYVEILPHMVKNESSRQDLRSSRSSTRVPSHGSRSKSGSRSRPTSARSRPLSAQSSRSVTLNSNGVPIRSDGSLVKSQSKRSKSQAKIKNKLGAVYFPAATNMLKKSKANKGSPSKSSSSRALTPKSRTSSSSSSGLPMLIPETEQRLVVQITKFDTLQKRYSLGNGESYRPTLAEIRQRGLTPTRNSSRPSTGNGRGSNLTGMLQNAAAMNRASSSGTSSPSRRKKDIYKQDTKKLAELALALEKSLPPVMSKHLPPAYYAPDLELAVHPRPGSVLLQEMDLDAENQTESMSSPRRLVMGERRERQQSPEKMVEARKKLLSPKHRKFAEDHFAQKGHFRKSYRHRYSPEYDFMGSVTHHELFDKIAARAQAQEDAKLAVQMAYASGEMDKPALKLTNGPTASDNVIEYMLSKKPSKETDDARMTVQGDETVSAALEQQRDAERLQREARTLAEEIEEFADDFEEEDVSFEQQIEQVGKDADETTRDLDIDLPLEGAPEAEDQHPPAATSAEQELEGEDATSEQKTNFVRFATGNNNTTTLEEEQQESEVGHQPSQHQSSELSDVNDRVTGRRITDTSSDEFARPAEWSLRDPAGNKPRSPKDDADGGSSSPKRGKRNKNFRKKRSKSGSPSHLNSSDGDVEDLAIDEDESPSKAGGVVAEAAASSSSQSGVAVLAQQTTELKEEAVAAATTVDAPGASGQGAVVEDASAAPVEMKLKAEETSVVEKPSTDTATAPAGAVPEQEPVEQPATNSPDDELPQQRIAQEVAEIQLLYGAERISEFSAGSQSKNTSEAGDQTARLLEAGVRDHVSSSGSSDAAKSKNIDASEAPTLNAVPEGTVASSAREIATVVLDNDNEQILGEDSTPAVGGGESEVVVPAGAEAVQQEPPEIVPSKQEGDEAAGAPTTSANVVDDALNLDNNAPSQTLEIEAEHQEQVDSRSTVSSKAKSNLLPEEESQSQMQDESVVNTNNFEVDGGSLATYDLHNEQGSNAPGSNAPGEVAFVPGGSATTGAAAPEPIFEDESQPFSHPVAGVDELENKEETKNNFISSSTKQTHNFLLSDASASATPIQPPTFRETITNSSSAREKEMEALRARDDAAEKADIEEEKQKALRLREELGLDSSDLSGSQMSV